MEIMPDLPLRRHFRSTARREAEVKMGEDRLRAREMKIIVHERTIMRRAQRIWTREAALLRNERMRLRALIDNDRAHRCRCCRVRRRLLDEIEDLDRRDMGIVGPSSPEYDPDYESPEF